ncbi:hypothetical protein LINPERHAP2_LOCUS9201 [Linum perenne]
MQLLLDAGDLTYQGSLPIGPFITDFLITLGVDVYITSPKQKVISLHPQHVFRNPELPSAPQRKNLDISKGGEKRVSFCGAKGQIISKLNFLASSIKKRNDWHIPLKMMMSYTLGMTISNFVGALKERVDWEHEDIQNLVLGRNQEAEDIKRMIMELYEKKLESEYASDFESDPEDDF